MNAEFPDMYITVFGNKAKPKRIEPVWVFDLLCRPYGADVFRNGFPALTFAKICSRSTGWANV